MLLQFIQCSIFQVVQQSYPNWDGQSSSHRCTSIAKYPVYQQEVLLADTYPGCGNGTVSQSRTPRERRSPDRQEVGQSILLDL